MAVRVRLAPGAGRPQADPLLVAALTTGVDAADAFEATGATREALIRLHRLGMLEWSVDGASASLLTPGASWPDGSPASTELSRFAIVRHDDGSWLVESGRSAWRVRLDTGTLALLPMLASDSARDLRMLLGLSGMLADHDADPAALGWEPHDRYFAAWSRTDVPRAEGYRLQDVRPAEPARRADPPAAPRLPLPAPSGPRPDEPTLWAASESRRSVRAFSDAPVPLADLGELLWRTLRVVRVLPADDLVPYDRVLRPVPSGGAMHATELWLVCARVEGVPVGVWRYDSFAHELVGQSGDVRPEQAISLMRDPAGSTPPIVAVITARHARTSWKYGGIALALELKDVGVIMAAVQLTAGALGLGMCPWGSGPTAGLARLLGVDPEIDMPVGEFVLGVPG
jgi:SagB-type dehydrogenase family enzyme